MMKKGFTLIEIMTAVSVFAVITTISMGSILTVFDVNRKSESIKTVMDNLNLALESMAREMRFGTNYICNPLLPMLDTITAPDPCTGGDTSVAFLATDGVTKIVYRQTDNGVGTGIEKSRDGGQSFVPVTAPELTIQDIKFFVIGALPSVSEGSPLQPKVLIRIRGVAGSKEGTKTSFTIQTLVSQRKLDV
jgi:prepilin-type N-terminal cleavage/methylation domain-containing protein